VALRDEGGDEARPVVVLRFLADKDVPPMPVFGVWLLLFALLLMLLTMSRFFDFF
jgi:hypothetical protein